jgi:uncharacterized membrane protein
MNMKHGVRWWLETAFLVDVLVDSIPTILLMLFAIWLVWRAFENW